MDNVSDLFLDLSKRTYCHGVYSKFIITDPKMREINKSSVRDRVVHHLLYTALCPYFDRKFIYDSYSCRLNKGTHRAIERFTKFIRTVSQNNTRTCWVLKCDIKKFFASINHKILKRILEKYITDADILWLLGQIIDSFNIPYSNRAIAQYEYIQKKGLPLGNLTSQLLVNVYMNEFDQYVKHILKIKYYIRYADDFVFLSTNKKELERLLLLLTSFLEEKLGLALHPDKVFIKTIASGVDFLGWIHFPHHRVLRTTTKRRMIKRTKNNPTLSTLASYKGMLEHGNAYKLRKHVSLIG